MNAPVFFLEFDLKLLSFLWCLLWCQGIARRDKYNYGDYYLCPTRFNISCNCPITDTGFDGISDITVAPAWLSMAAPDFPGTRETSY
jgi:hypothetical protein